MMYKVFIADDECWVVESLKASIRWEEFGFEVAGQAFNGIDALNLIREIKPDVIFTDIRMPGMNGLDLIKKVKELPLKAQFIIVSGYAEFAYAQKAIGSGAIGYCLKPFDDTEIAVLLNKAKQIIEASGDSWESRLVDLLDSPDLQKQAEVYKLLKKAGLQPESPKGMLVAVTLGNRGPEFPSAVKAIRLKIGIQKYAYLIENKGRDYIKKYLSETGSEAMQSMGVALPVKEVGDIKEAIESANVAVYQFFITERKDLYEAKHLGKDDVSGILHKLEEVIDNRDAISVEKLFKEIEDCFSKGKYNIRHAFLIYNMAMSYINGAGENYEEFVYSYDQLLGLFKNVRGMLTQLKKSIIEQIAMKPDNKLENVKNEIFRNILGDVNDHFLQDISINSLSQKYFINTSYLCQLFKKELGMTFTEYISSLRIHYACRLLTNSGFSVHEISEKCGYRDYFYFTRVFKRLTGKTPSQYREENA